MNVKLLAVNGSNTLKKKKSLILLQYVMITPIVWLEERCSVILVLQADFIWFLPHIQ